MSIRPHANLRRVLEDLGATLLELACGSPGDGVEIGGVAIHDPVDEPVLPRHALVLGVGVREPAEIASLLRALGGHQAAGLGLRLPVPVPADVSQAVEESGVRLLGLTRGASWTQLAALLRSLLAEGDVGDDGPETLGGIPSGDLFAVANAVAALGGLRERRVPLAVRLRKPRWHYLPQFGAFTEAMEWVPEAAALRWRGPAARGRLMIRHDAGDAGLRWARVESWSHDDEVTVRDIGRELSPGGRPGVPVPVAATGIVDWAIWVDGEGVTEGARTESIG
jgi:hypothetical protein